MELWVIAMYWYVLATAKLINILYEYWVKIKESCCVLSRFYYITSLIKACVFDQDHQPISLKNIYVVLEIHSCCYNRNILKMFLHPLNAFKIQYMTSQNVFVFIKVKHVMTQGHQEMLHKRHQVTLLVQLSLILVTEQDLQ